VKVVTKTVALTRKAIQYNLGSDLQGVVASLWNENAESRAEQGLTVYFYEGGSNAVGSILFKHDFILDEVEVVTRAGDLEGGTPTITTPSTSTAPAPTTDADIVTSYSAAESLDTSPTKKQIATQAVEPVAGLETGIQGGGPDVGLEIMCNVVLFSSEDSAHAVIKQVIQSRPLLAWTTGGPNSYNLQGSWDDVFGALKEAKLQLPNTLLTITLDS